MTDLSPAAQAVLDATDYPEDWATRIRVAAALRAAADQAAPLIDDPEFFCGDCCERVVKREREETRAALLAIAAELEGASAE